MWTNFPLRRTAEGRPWCGFVGTVRWLFLNPLVKIESAYFRVKVRKLDRHAVKMHRRRRQTAGDEPLCGSGDGFPLHQPRSPICSFFSATPFDTQPLSAAGGRSSFINNQCASYTICQHVCDVMCVCVFPILQRGSLPLPSLSVKQDGVAAPRGCRPMLATHGIWEQQRAFFCFFLTVAHLGPIFSPRSWNCWGSPRLCSLAKDLEFGARPELSLFLSFLFARSGHRLPNCTLFCLPSGRLWNALVGWTGAFSASLVVCLGVLVRKPVWTRQV